MSVIGNSPATSFKTIQKQSITGTGATAYALNYPVSSPNDLEVFVNNIRQEPIISYNASTQTITFSEAVDSTDSVYVIYQGQTMGSVLDTTAYRKAEVDAAVTTKVSKTGDTMTGVLALPTGGLNVGSGQLTVDTSGRVRMQYQPSFFAYHNAPDVNYGPDTTLPYQNVLHNTGGHYNTSTSTFTAPIDGAYLFSATCNGNYTGSYSGIPRAYWQINSTNIGNAVHFRGPDATDQGLEQRSSTVILQLSANDTVRIQVLVNQFDLFGANHFCGQLIG